MEPLVSVENDAVAVVTDVVVVDIDGHRGKPCSRLWKQKFSLRPSPDELPTVILQLLARRAWSASSGRIFYDATNAIWMYFYLLARLQQLAPKKTGGPRADMRYLAVAVRRVKSIHTYLRL